MASEFNIDSSNFRSLKTTSKRMFKSISKRLNVNTAYVTRRGKTAMTVLSSFNDKEEIIPENYSVEYGGTYCRLIITSENKSLTTLDLTEDLLTKDLEVSSQLGMKGFLGVSLTDLSGNVFGTLCVMDPEERNFSEEDIDYLKSMAEILSHIIEFDQTKFNMSYLTVPIIPITEGVSILSIQGIIDEERAEKLAQTVLHYGADSHILHFVFDLSGLIILDGDFPQVIADLVKSLKLMGIETLITGITPEIAKYDLIDRHLSEVDAIKVRSLEQALAYIGFQLEKRQ
jgi:rsbT co-antagonist protein RsbR